MNKNEKNDPAPVAEDLITAALFSGAVIHAENKRLVAICRDLAAYLSLADSTVRIWAVEEKIRFYAPRWYDVLDALAVKNASKGKPEGKLKPTAIAEKKILPGVMPLLEEAAVSGRMEKQRAYFSGQSYVGTPSKSEKLARKRAKGRKLGWVWFDKHVNDGEPIFYQIDGEELA